MVDLFVREDHNKSMKNGVVCFGFLMMIIVIITAFKAVFTIFNWSHNVALIFWSYIANQKNVFFSFFAFFFFS